MKIKHLLKNKKGFTLIELVVSVAIFAILGAGSMGLFVMVSNIYHQTSSTTQLRTTTSNIVNYIKTYVETSDYVEILDTADGLNISSTAFSIPGDGNYESEKIKDLSDDISFGMRKVGYIYYHPKSDGPTTFGFEEKDGLYISYPGSGTFSALGVNGLYGGGYNYYVYFSTGRHSDAANPTTIGQPINNVLHVTVEVWDDTNTELKYEYQTDIWLYNVFEEKIERKDSLGNVVYDTATDPTGATPFIDSYRSFVDSSSAPLSRYGNGNNPAGGITINEGKCLRFVSNLPADN